MADNERSRPGLNRTAPDDLLAGGIESDSTVDLAELSVSIEAAALSVMLGCAESALARTVIYGVQPESFLSLEHQAVWRGIVAAIESGLPPHPVAVAQAIVRHKIELPPTWRGTLQSRLWDLASSPPPVPMAGWLLGQVREQAVRRRVEGMLAALGSVVHQAELPELAAVIQREVSSVLALLAEVTG